MNLIEQRNMIMQVSMCDLCVNQTFDDIFLLFGCHVSNQTHVVSLMLEPNVVVVVWRCVIFYNLVEIVFSKERIQSFSACVCMHV